LVEAVSVMVGVIVDLFQLLSNYRRRLDWMVERMDRCKADWAYFYPLGIQVVQLAASACAAAVAAATSARQAGVITLFCIVGCHRRSQLC
jgi:hypothetical protein